MEKLLNEVDVQHLEPLLDEGLPLVHESVDRNSGKTWLPEKWTDPEGYARPTETKEFIGKLRAGLNLSLIPGAQAIDFDLKHDPERSCYDDFKRIISADYPKLWAKLVKQTTKSGGYHLIFICEERGGNETLAFRKGANAAMIETRAKGGQVWIFPTHGYEVIEGDLTRIPMLETWERDVLFDVARSLNERDIDKEKRKAFRSYKSEGSRPRDVYNAEVDRAEVIRMLEELGFEEAFQTTGGLRLKRIESDNPHSAMLFLTEGKPPIFYSHSPNCEPLPTQKGLTPYQLYVYLHHRKYNRGTQNRADAELEKRGFGAVDKTNRNSDALDFLDALVEEKGLYFDESTVKTRNAEDLIFSEAAQSAVYIEMARMNIKPDESVWKRYWLSALPRRNRLKEFFDKLPESTGELERLLDCVVFNEAWLRDPDQDLPMLRKLLRKCLVSTVGTAVDSDFSGVLLPVLQGVGNFGKTTFLEFINGVNTIEGVEGVPELAEFFLNRFDVAHGNERIRDTYLCSRLIACVDDGDGFWGGGKNANKLRALSSQKYFDIQMLWKNETIHLARTATIWTTTNHSDVIHDVGNNRRIIPFPISFISGCPQLPKDLPTGFKCPSVMLRDIEMRKVWREALDLYRASQGNAVLNPEEIGWLNEYSREWRVDNDYDTLVENYIRKGEDKNKHFYSTSDILRTWAAENRNVNRKNGDLLCFSLYNGQMQKPLLRRALEDGGYKYQNLRIDGKQQRGFFVRIIDDRKNDVL